MNSVILEKVTREDYFKRPNFTKEDVKKTLDKVVGIVDHMLLKFHDDIFPTAASHNYVYGAVGNLVWNDSNFDSVWTTSFWTGILWLVYEYTNDEKYKDLTIDGENITDKNSLIQSLNACIEKYEKFQPEQHTS